jgi:hypothetical protein
VDEIPRPGGSLLPLDDQQAVTGDHEEVLVIGLPVSRFSIRAWSGMRLLF